MDLFWFRFVALSSKENCFNHKIIEKGVSHVKLYHVKNRSQTKSKISTENFF